MKNYTFDSPAITTLTKKQSLQTFIRSYHEAEFTQASVQVVTSCFMPKF